MSRLTQNDKDTTKGGKQLRDKPRTAGEHTKVTEKGQRHGIVNVNGEPRQRENTWQGKAYRDQWEATELLSENSEKTEAKTKRSECPNRGLALVMVIGSSNVQV